MKHLLIRIVLILTVGLILSLGSLIIVSRHEVHAYAGRTYVTQNYGAHGFPLGYFITHEGTACNGGFEYSFRSIFTRYQCDRSFSDGGSLFFFNWLIWAVVVSGSYTLVAWYYTKVISRN